MTPTMLEIHERHKNFHAAIARRAALIKPKQETRVIVIPNTPFKEPKIPPKPKRNIEPDYWHLMWFHDLVYGRSRNEPTSIRFEDIFRAVGAEFKVSKIDLLSTRRTNDLVLPRQIVCYLARKLTRHGFAEIGRRVGGRDHSTALFSVNKIETLLATDEALKERVCVIARLLGGSLA